MVEQNRNLIEDSKKNKIIMGRNTQISIEDDNERQLAVYKIPYGAKLFCDNNEKIRKGKKICSVEKNFMFSVKILF